MNETIFLWYNGWGILFLVIGMGSLVYSLTPSAITAIRVQRFFIAVYLISLCCIGLLSGWKAALLTIAGTYLLLWLGAIVLEKIYKFLGKGAEDFQAPPTPQNIEEAIRIKIEKPEGELTEEDFQKVDWLRIHGKNSRHRDLEGLMPNITLLAKLSNLQSISLEGNGITDLTSLKGVTRLRVICLQRNEISDLTPLSGLTELERLELSDNRITDLTPLAGLTKLKHLDVGNYAEGKSFWVNAETGEMVPKAAVELSDNRISDLTPLKGLTELDHLWLRGLQITDLTPLKGLIKLRNLRLGGGNPNLTKREVDNLKEVLPSCEISHDLKQPKPEVVDAELEMHDLKQPKPEVVDAELEIDVDEEFGQDFLDLCTSIQAILPLAILPKEKRPLSALQSETESYKEFLSNLGSPADRMGNRIGDEEFERVARSCLSQRVVGLWNIHLSLPTEDSLNQFEELFNAPSQAEMNVFAKKQLNAISAAFVDVEDLTEDCLDGVKEFCKKLSPKDKFGSFWFEQDEGYANVVRFGSEACLLIQSLAGIKDQREDQWESPPHEISNLINRVLFPKVVVVYLDMDGSATGLLLAFEPKNVKGFAEKIAQYSNE